MTLRHVFGMMTPRLIPILVFALLSAAGKAYGQPPDKPPEGALFDSDDNLSDGAGAKKKPVESGDHECGRGPRRVVQGRPGDIKRAKRLGLGTRAVGSKLLRSAPEARWVRASHWSAPKTGDASDEALPRAVLRWPVPKGRLGRGFGFTRKEKPGLRHEGIDIGGVGRGSAVTAAADGLVVYSDNGLCGYGNVVLIVHPNGWVTLYAHNERNLVAAGHRVRKGDLIARMGDTGRARGAHSHFELHINGLPTDPMPYFKPAKGKSKKSTRAKGTQAKKKKRGGATTQSKQHRIK